MLLLSIVIIFLLLYAALLFYYKKGWDGLPEYVPKPAAQPVFISVIVPARNEENTIALLLSSLQDQTYPKGQFEVIIVDDFSTDGTQDIVRPYISQNIKIIQPGVHHSVSSKKKAIETGVQQATGKLIVATDSDCIVPPGWLVTISNFYADKEAQFIAAPVKFVHNGSFLQTFQAIDFLVLQGITAASVSLNFHNMCNGANLAYTKQAFVEAGGFQGIEKVASGDDMLLMHKIWKRYPGKVFYLKSKTAVVQTAPMLTWAAFFSQRIRWASKTVHYDDRRVFLVLLFIYVFNVLFIVLLLAGFFNPLYWLAALIYWIVKAGAEVPFVYAVARFYKEKKLLRSFFFFQPVHIFYTVIIGLVSQFGKYEWKGRRTR
jgi:glycosyltransferase involved in cell wall biosynthesis